MEPRTITTVQAAELLGVSKQTVQKWVDAGHLPAWRTVGGHRRLDLDAVERMVRDRAAVMGRGWDVLLVEDNAIEAELAAACIAEVFPGARLRRCTDGVTGLVEVGRSVPDLLVTDVRLPGLDGLAMIARLRENPVTQAMRIVIVSSFSPRELKRRFGDWPPEVPVLGKPLDPAALRSAVRGAPGDAPG